MDWTKIGDIAKSLAAILGLMTAVTGLLTAIIKPLRKKVKNYILKVSETEAQQSQIDGLSDKIEELIKMMSDHIDEDGKFKKEMSENVEILKKGSALSLGNMIKEIYNHYKDEKRIPEKEFEIVRKMYAIYHDALHGNGVIEKIYIEITTTWEVIID